MATSEGDIPPPPPKLDQPKNGSNNLFMPKRNQRERDVWAAERWAKNSWTFQQIADALEIKSKGHAYYYVQRGLAVTGAPAEAAAAEARAIHRARLEAATEVAFEVMSKDHIHLSQGQVVKDEDGEPILDDGPKLAAVDRIRSLSESLRKLDGLDAPQRHELTMGDIDAALDKLDAAIAAARSEGSETAATEAEAG